jgi:hypothetical protein
MSGGMHWPAEWLDAYERRRKSTEPAQNRAQANPRPSKYGNVPTDVDGERLDSKREAKRYRELILLYKAGEISKPVRQVRFPLPGGVVYVADFLFVDKARGLVVEDAKGMRTPQYRDKAKQMRACWGIEVQEV